MRTIGFVISHKNNEKRRAALPADIAGSRYAPQLYFETGYGETLGLSDEDCIRCGAHVAARADILACDVLVDPKLGDADFMEEIAPGKTLFGWAHAAQKTDFTESALQKGHTVIAWEEMDHNGRNLFYRNREVAGEAAVLQAFLYMGRMPYDARVAILGRGNTARGAMRVLHGLGAQVDVYGRQQEALFKEKMHEYDMLVNCIMWDLSRKDRIITRADLQRLRKGSMIVDVSNDQDLTIETSHSTSFDDPVYTVDGILHYVVDNTPAMFPYTVSKELSRHLAPYWGLLAEGKEDEILKRATVLAEGRILDEKVRAFRAGLGLPLGK